MRRHLSLFLLLTALLVPGYLAAQDEPAAQRGEPAAKTPALKFGLFHDLNYDKALAQAKKQDKLVMLDFTTTWCGWCRKLEADTFSKEAVQKYLGQRAIPIQVDGDKQTDLVQKYKVRGYPTLVFVDAEGEEVGRIVGYRPPEQFMEAARQEIGKEKAGS